MPRAWIAVSPYAVLAAAALAVLIVVSIRRGHLGAFLTAAAGLVVAGACLPLAGGAAPAGVTPVLLVDDHAIWFTGVVLAGALGVVLLAPGYFAAREEPPEEIYALLLLASLGAAVLTASDHVISLFLGLEILSVSLYAMIGYLRAGERSVEAAVKYLVLAATGSAVLLFGAALLYAGAGALALPALAAGLEQGEPIAIAGAILLFGGLAFKLALVPFHMWTPDVYQGAPAPVTAFIATVSKVSVVALALRIYGAFAPSAGGSLFLALALVAAASMIAGNVLALLQQSIKRILAYSSIAHLGYLLVPVLAGGRAGAVAAGYYAAAYVAMTLLAFGVVTVVSTRDSGEAGTEGDADLLEDYRGLMWRRPLLAFGLGLSVLSLAGIPLTGGFVAKLYVLAAGAGEGMWALVLIVALTSGLGLFYYLRILVVTFLNGSAGETLRELRVPAPAGAVLALAGLAVIWLGVYPETVRGFLEAAAAALG